MPDPTPQDVAGCAKGCALIFVAAVVLTVVSCLANGGVPESSESDPAPVQQEHYDESLCEGSDYADYDDCKRY